MAYNSQFLTMIICEDEGVVTDPCHLIRRLDQVVGIRSHVTHLRAAGFGLKLLDGRIGPMHWCMERLSGDRVDRWSMVDEQDAKSVSVLVRSHIHTMEIERPISIITREIFDSKPLQPRSKRT